ncbi:hypothetical protein GE21DRAFT_1276924 [Neurospora crassa]|nr:hypothetical protein GE21DRAFT_1276924 [Neurospora crassa]
MSGLEVISIISNVISIIDAVCKVVSACKDVNGLPDAMREVRVRLPLVEDTLERIKECMKMNGNKKSLDAMDEVLKACEEKATLLGTIFKADLPPPSSRPSARKRFTTAAIMTLHVGKSRKVESLMRGILDDIRLLADNRALDACDNAARHQVRESAALAIRTNLDFSGSGTPTVPYMDDRPLSPASTTSTRSDILKYSNIGSGMQCIHLGNGTQNNNNGQGFFGSGPVTGTFHFTNAARC